MNLVYKCSILFVRVGVRQRKQIPKLFPLYNKLTIKVGEYLEIIQIDFKNT